MIRKAQPFSSPHKMHISQGRGTPKRSCHKWKRVARQLGHNNEAKVVTRKRLVEVCGIFEQSQNQMATWGKCWSYFYFQNWTDSGWVTTLSRDVITLSWNCQSLGNPWTIRELRHLISDKSPSIIFLMETKCPKVQMENASRKVDFTNCFVVDSVGKRGGLVML